jgi:hypothetical protein
VTVYQNCLNPAIVGGDGIKKNEYFELRLTGCDGGKYQSNLRPNQDLSAESNDFVFFRGTMDGTRYVQVVCTKDGCPDVATGKTIVLAACDPPAAPIISSVDEIESNKEFTISAIGCSNESTFNWSHGGTPIRMSSVPRGSGSSGLLVSITSDTQFSVTCTENGCTSPTAYKTVRVKPCALPNFDLTGPNTVIRGQNGVMLNAFGCPAGSTYHWSPYGGHEDTDEWSSSATYYNVQESRTYSVYCTKDNCTSATKSFTVEVKDIPQPVDRTPKWQPTSDTCNVTGVVWQDINPNSTTTGQTKCVGGTPCITYEIQVQDGSGEYSDNPYSCSSCVVYRGCDGSKRVSSFSTMTSESKPYTIEALENFIECRGCSSIPKLTPKP